MHNDYVRPYGRWCNVSVPSAADMQRFDELQHTAVSGATGRTVTPTTPYVFGGAGLNLGLNALLYGGAMRVASDGHLVMASAEPKLLSLATRTVRMPLGQVSGDVGTVYSDGSGVKLNSITSSAQNKNQIIVPIPPEYLHHGSTLSKVRVSWTAAASGLPPQYTPYIQLYSSDDSLYPWDAWVAFGLLAPSTLYTSGDRVLAQSNPNGLPISVVLRCTVTGTTAGGLYNFILPIVGETLVYGSATFVVDFVYGMTPEFDGSFPTLSGYTLNGTVIHAGQYYMPSGNYLTGTSGQSRYQYYYRCVYGCGTASVSPGPTGGWPTEPGTLVVDDGPPYATTVTASFVQPGVGSTVTVQVTSSSWMTGGDIWTVHVEGGGQYTIVSMPDATHAVLRNVGTAGENVSPGVTVPGSSALYRGALWICVGRTGRRRPETTDSDYRQHGQLQWLELHPAFNNVIDSAKCYYLRIVDEFGTNSQAGNTFHCAELTFTDITDLRFP